MIKIHVNKKKQGQKLKLIRRKIKCQKKENQD
jgi:hypothetical protein